MQSKPCGPSDGSRISSKHKAYKATWSMDPGTVTGDYVGARWRQEGPVVPSEKICGSLGMASATGQVEDMIQQGYIYI